MPSNCSKQHCFHHNTRGRCYACAKEAPQVRSTGASFKKTQRACCQCVSNINNVLAQEGAPNPINPLNPAGGNEPYSSGAPITVSGDRAVLSNTNGPHLGPSSTSPMACTLPPRQPSPLPPLARQPTPGRSTSRPRTVLQRQRHQLQLLKGTMQAEIFSVLRYSSIEPSFRGVLISGTCGCQYVCCHALGPFCQWCRGNT